MSGFDSRSSLKILGFFLYPLGFHSTTMIMFTFMILDYFDNFVFSYSCKEKCLFFGISLPWSTNRPLPSSKTLTLGRSSAEPFLWIENDFYLYENEKNHLHIKGWALNLVLIQRPDGTRILPIADIKFFILVPRYWRGTKVHGPCDRGPWLWFLNCKLIDEGV